MTTAEIARKLRRMGGQARMQILNHQDCKFLIDAADRLTEQEERIAIMAEGREATEEQLRFPPAAKLMSLQDIWDAPDHSVLWEEICLTGGDVDLLAPVEKIGGQLNGCSGIVTFIGDHMFEDDLGRARYWDARPTDEERKAAKWG